MRRALLPVMLACALTLPARGFAQDASPDSRSDAPVILDAGQPAPTRGLLLPEVRAVKAAQELARLREENAELKKSAAPAWWVPAVVGVVALGAGVSLGYGVSAATRPK